MDTYFTEYESAYHVAKQKNRSGIFNDLDICYYNGDKQDNGELENLIHLPLEHIYDYFTETPNRHPLNFISGIEDAKLKNDIQEFLQVSQSLAWDAKLKICNQYKEEVSKLEPDFSEPLRILFITTRITTVLQFATRNIEEVFRKMGYETFISIESNAMQSWGANDSRNNANFAWHLKNILHFNPHIIFNIDWVNNEFLNDKIFNFTWYQDPMPILFNGEEIKKRDRDYFFYILDSVGEAIEKKGISKDHIFWQPFCTNSNLFFRREDIQREEKIVFLGGDYKGERNLPHEEEVIPLLVEMLNDGTLSNEKLREISEKYDMDYDYLDHELLTTIARRETVKWICMQDKYPVEIYGTDAWLDTPEVAKYYKGLLPYGEEMAKVYNSAKYALVAHHHYMYQQRLFEISACGAIPIVYDSGVTQENFVHKDNVLVFHTHKEFEDCIGKVPKSNPDQIAKDLSFETFANKILDIVKNNA